MRISSYWFTKMLPVYIGFNIVVFANELFCVVAKRVSPDTRDDITGNFIESPDFYQLVSDPIYWYIYGVEIVLAALFMIIYGSRILRVLRRFPESHQQVSRVTSFLSIVISLFR